MKSFLHRFHKCNPISPDSASVIQSLRIPSGWLPPASLPACGGAVQSVNKKRAQASLARFLFPSCGEIGIRTLVTVTRQPALQTGALDHSAISPGGLFGSANIVYFLLRCYIAEKKSYSQHKLLLI